MKPLKLIAPLFLFAVLLSGCFGRYAMKHPEEYLNASAFPEDIKKDGYILLIQKQETSKLSSKAQNNAVYSLMRKHYNKPFEMVSSADLKSNPKYADKEKYKYVFRKLKKDDSSMSQTVSRDAGTTTVFIGTTPTTVNRSVSTTITYSDMVIEDRSTGKVYPETRHATNTFEEAMMLIAPYLGKMK